MAVRNILEKLSGGGSAVKDTFHMMDQDQHKQ